MAAFPTKSITRWLLLHLGIPLIYLLYRLLSLTLRIQRVDLSGTVMPAFQAGNRFTAAFFHGDSFMMANELRNHIRVGHGRTLLMASKSRDGELMARFLELCGARVVRGSSSRGGARALLEMARSITPDENAGLAVDGPRGPRHQVKEGILILALRANRPVLPIAIRIEKKWAFRSWDRMEIPRPFSRVTAFYDEPVPVPPSATPEELEALRLQIQNRLVALKGESTA